MKYSYKNIAIIGSEGAIGKALVNLFIKKPSTQNIFCFSRKPSESNLNDKIKNITINIEEEASIENATQLVPNNIVFDCIIIATGFLHNDSIKPEKSFKEMNYESFEKNFQVNTIGPALIAKHFLTKLDTDQKSIFAFLSARVGSISDNYLGGWHSYRASKAALNMIIKNLSIETRRKNKNAIIVGLHPGTVDSNISKPFQANVPTEKLFTPEFSANKLLGVIDSLDTKDNGKIFAWDGKIIDY